MSDVMPAGLGGAAWAEADLRYLITLQPDQARNWLIEQAGPGDAGLLQLCSAALGAAEPLPDLAGALLDLAAELLPDAQDEPGVRGSIAYARARHRLVTGEPAEAEQSLRAAQSAWQAEQWGPSRARSYLGLTQILAEQGRYAEAEAAVRTAVAELSDLADEQPALQPLLVVAWRNLANLYSVQDRHADALPAFDAAAALLDEMAEEDRDAQYELAHLELNRAVSWMYLDEIAAAEAALVAAADRFAAQGDALNRGRARTNLGALLARTGRYGEAIEAFNRAADDLLGPDAFAAGERAGDLRLDRLRQADMLFLEQAGVYLALNLLAEAEAALDRAERIFRADGRPYELGQTLYALGALLLRKNDSVAAAAALAEGAGIFADLGNEYWRIRTRLAEAAVALFRGAPAAAAALLSLAALPAIQRGQLALEHGLLRARLGLALSDGAEAAAGLDRAAAVLEELAPAGGLPHFRYQLEHLRGRLAYLNGELGQARRYFFAAVDLIENQRVGLPLEEARTAYLDDKAVVYSDLIRSLLEDPGASDEAVALAFDVVARAHSQTLLERLLANLPATADPDLEARRQEIYQELHWLYNRLLGDAGDSRRSLVAVSQAVAAREAALQQIAWRRAPALHDAEPAALGDLQAVLAEDEQALVYFTTAGYPAESSATPDALSASDLGVVFVVDRRRVSVVRLASNPALLEALREWRFQLGRAEVGPEYRLRRHEHLLEGARGALATLYDQLIRPVRSHLTRPRLLIVPHGPLHQLPFHALFDGARFLVEEYECAYAPGVSVAVKLLRTARALPAVAQGAAFAGFALSEPGIPHTREEVANAAAHFERAHAYCDAAATRANFAASAGEADIIHLATHGLFRATNPYFSALKLADGWLDVRTLYELKVRAELVVLSTCESGAGHVHGGGDVIGITRGFLGAGARRLVASLWNLHDASAAALMDDFYRSLQANGVTRPAAALRQAQRASIGRNEHPYFWASFHAIQ
jgi:tetratricopeptide (TPR) repeat protein